jgi:GMP synthase (glutamine-hydrolysing)
VEELKALSNVKGIIINGGPNNVIDGVAIDVNPAIYAMGIPVMAAGHDKAACEVKLAEFTDDIEAIKNAVKAFVFDTCKAEANWNMTNFVNDQIELIKRQVGDKKVLLALSGGVDSSVVAALLLKAIGDNLVCVHVNHGLMRKGESEDVVEVFSNQLKANLIYLDVTDRFLDKLAGVEDPEQKRKIIGSEFIRVFEEEARKLDGIDFLGQGTIYPDIVESGTKTAKMVKSHHNVGGLPEDLKFQLVEPLRQLFKDEVRACGLELGLPYEMVYRQPFPNRFLASLSPFLAQHLDEPAIRTLVLNSFIAFLRRNVMQYDYKQYPAHFIGSVAHCYKDILQEAAQQTGIQVGKILQSPMEGLIQYHQK